MLYIDTRFNFAHFHQGALSNIRLELTAVSLTALQPIFRILKRKNLNQYHFMERRKKHSDAMSKALGETFFPYRGDEQEIQYLPSNDFLIADYDRKNDTYKWFQITILS